MKANVLNAERGGSSRIIQNGRTHVKASRMTSTQQQRKSALRDEGRWSEMLGETKSELKKAERERCNGVIRLLIAPREMCFGLTPGQLSVAPRLLNTRLTRSTKTHTPHSI